MIEQLKQLLSEVTVHIQQDVNKVEISFSFKDEEPIKFEPQVHTEAQDLADKMAKNMAKNRIEQIVEESGIPKDNVIIASSPKVEEKKSNVFNTEDKIFRARIKKLKDMGWIDEKKDQQVTYKGVGLSYGFIGGNNIVTFDSAVKTIMEKNETVQAKAKTEGAATTTGNISDAQQELIEMEFSLPAEDLNAGIKPASPEEAFEVPEKPITEPAKETVKSDKPEGPPAPTASDDDPDTCKFIAKNPVEQMKKNQGKPYLNKIDELIIPQVADKPELSKQELWDSLMAKCAANEISTDGIEFEEQSIEDIKNLHEWVDEQLEELA